jgi:transposase
MAKYSIEFKQKVASTYLQGKTNCHGLAKKYNIVSHISILRWVSAYKSIGKDSSRSRQKKT